MGGEDSRAGEEDSGLSPPNHERCDLEREAGAWLGELHFLGRAPEGRKDPEGRHGQRCVRLASRRPPRLPDPLLGIGLVGAPKRVALLSRVCLEREASGFRTWGSGFRGREKNDIRGRRHPSKHNSASRSPCRQKGRALLARCLHAFLARADFLYHSRPRNESGRRIGHSLK